ncbi:hypothetical protein MNBD_NITROSPIRAE03-2005, partial [hydrothermal vent metagenome]
MADRCLKKYQKLQISGFLHIITIRVIY